MKEIIYSPTENTITLINDEGEAKVGLPDHFNYLLIVDEMVNKCKKIIKDKSK